MTPLQEHIHSIINIRGKKQKFGVWNGLKDDFTKQAFWLYKPMIKFNIETLKELKKL